jgi:hypothetical protein
MGGGGLSAEQGVEIIDMKDSECKEMMKKFVERNLELCWTEPWFVEEQ